MKKILANYKQEIIVILVVLFSRLLTVFIGVVFVTNSLNANVDDLQKAFVHWDGEWYMQIINEGYDSDFSSFEPGHWYCNTGEGNCQRNFAFFPLFPISVIGLSNFTGLDHTVSGILISNLSFVIAALLLFKLTKELVNARVAWFSLAVIIVAPTSYIFSAFMSESLYLMLFLSSVYLAFKSKWLLAGISGVLLSATRNTGILIIPVLLAIYIEKKYEGKKFPGFTIKLIKSLDYKVVLSILLAGIGLVAFMLYLNSIVGDPLAFINIQKYWEKPVNGISPFLAIPYSFLNWQLESSLKIHVYNLGYFMLLATLGLWGWKKKKLPVSQLLIMTFVFIPMLSGSMLALPRYIGVLYPIYILAGMVIARFKRIGGILLLLSAVMSLIMLNAYVHGLWITV